MHELGHAFSLPHWGESAWDINPTKWQYLYPYSGDAGYRRQALRRKGEEEVNPGTLFRISMSSINPICQFNAVEEKQD